jgi:hypothetical protein
MPPRAARRQGGTPACGYARCCVARRRQIDLDGDKLSLTYAIYHQRLLESPE